MCKVRFARNAAEPEKDIAVFGKRPVFSPAT